MYWAERPTDGPFESYSRLNKKHTHTSPSALCSSRLVDSAACFNFCSRYGYAFPLLDSERTCRTFIRRGQEGAFYNLGGYSLECEDT